MAANASDAAGAEVGHLGCTTCGGIAITFGSSQPGDRCPVEGCTGTLAEVKEVEPGCLCGAPDCPNPGAYRFVHVLESDLAVYEACGYRVRRTKRMPVALWSEESRRWYAGGRPMSSVDDALRLFSEDWQLAALGEALERSPDSSRSLARALCLIAVNRPEWRREPL
jgi:hypothetical protein